MNLDPWNSPQGSALKQWLLNGGAIHSVCGFMSNHCDIVMSDILVCLSAFAHEEAVKQGLPLF